MIGLFFNGLFSADYVIGLDGVSTGMIPGGWVNRNWAQLYIQIAYIVAVTAYSFVVSLLIAWLINMVPGLHLRVSEQAELVGTDDDQLGEFAYDYVEVRRDYLAWTPQRPYGQGNGVDGRAGPEDIPMHQRHGIAAHCDLLEGRDPESGESSPNGTTTDAHKKIDGIQGDRHAVAAEDREKERHGRVAGEGVM